MDTVKATPMAQVIDALLGDPAGRDRVQEIPKEIEARLPGSIDGMAASLRMRRLQHLWTSPGA